VRRAAANRSRAGRPAPRPHPREQPDINVETTPRIRRSVDDLGRLLPVENLARPLGFAEVGCRACPGSDVELVEQARITRAYSLTLAGALSDPTAGHEIGIFTWSLDSRPFRKRRRVPVPH